MNGIGLTAPSCRRQSRVLDIGCGNGALLDALSPPLNLERSDESEAMLGGQQRTTGKANPCVLKNQFTFPAIEDGAF